MRRPYGLVAALTLCWWALADRATADVIVPNSFASTTGGGQSTVVFQSTARTYLGQVASSQLGGLNVGDLITGMTFRMNTVYAASSAAASWNNFDIKLAQATNSIASMDTIFANNMVNAVQVRSGALSLAAGAYQGGASAPNANPFGYVINFSTPYTYQGGDLVWQITHGAMTSGSTISIDAVVASNIGAGYGTLFRAYAASNDTATSGSVTNFAVTQFMTSGPVSAAPEPGTLVLSGLAAVCGGGGVWWRRRRKARRVSSGCPHRQKEEPIPE